MNLKFAVVKWTDSTYLRMDYIEDEKEMEILHPKTLISCGFLIYEDEECIVIAQDLVQEEKPIRMVISIPKVSVIDYVVFTKKLKNF